MDDATTQAIQATQSQQPAILRIKRKRTDEPLDALVVESRTRRKKSRGGSGFFKFAETVEEDTFWQDPSLTKDLRTRISTLANVDLSEKVQRETVSPRVTPGRRYTIVKNGREPKSPPSPVVHTFSQPKGLYDDSDFTMYDAIPETNSFTNKATDPVDSEMAKFLPMLQEYLRMNDEPSNIASTSANGVQGGEYVWDVFYHRPAITELAAVVNVATVSGLPPLGQYDSDSDSESAGDEDDEDSNTEDFYRNDYPDEDPDQQSDESPELSASDEYPELSEDEDERDLHAFLAWRGRR